MELYAVFSTLSGVEHWSIAEPSVSLGDGIQWRRAPRSAAFRARRARVLIVEGWSRRAASGLLDFLV
jgi:hypothetical protein